MKRRMLTVVLGLVLVMGLTISGSMAAGASELILDTITAEYSGFASWCKFTNINLDGATPSQIYITPEEDHATITPVYSGGKLISAEIAVSW